MPSIRASMAWRRRPTAVIMRDDWFGKRDPWTGEPSGTMDEFTSWDYALMDAFQTIEDFTDQKSGIPIWELDDEAVYVDAVRKFNKFQQAIDNATKGSKSKAYEPAPGEYFVPDMGTRRKDADGSPIFQSYSEWVRKSVEDAPD